MKKRLIEKDLREQLKLYPAVTIIGPRQAGKTTLAEMISSRYFDLEQPTERVRLETQWNDLMDSEECLVFDEAQFYPPLFPKLRGAIDAQRKRNGRFLLLGSIAPSLMYQVSESLAGRLSILHMHPLNMIELGFDSMDALWFYGGYPDGGILGTNTYPRWQKSYVEAIVLRDLPKYGLEVSSVMAMKLLLMLCHMNGQIWNASEIARSLGVTYHTVNRYTDFLEGTFLIRRLQPYYANIGKRLVKSPKIYWIDSGLYNAMMEIEDFDDMTSRPGVGFNWEGFVIQQVISMLEQKGVMFKCFYFRSYEGKEIDLIIESGRKRIAIEIKLSSDLRQEDVKQLDYCAQIIQATHQILVCRTKTVIENEGNCYCSLGYMLQYLEKILS